MGLGGRVTAGNALWLLLPGQGAGAVLAPMLQCSAACTMVGLSPALVQSKVQEPISLNPKESRQTNIYFY